MSSVRISLNGIKKLQRDMPKLLDTVEKRIAKKAPSVIVENVYRGVTGIFPANSLPFNKPSTIKRKGHGIRLDDAGDLLTGNWRVEKTTAGYLVKPPSNRANVVGYLNERTTNRPAYKILEIPLGFFPNWAAIISQRFFKKVIPNYS